MKLFFRQKATKKERRRITEELRSQKLRICGRNGGEMESEAKKCFPGPLSRGDPGLQIHFELYLIT
jgi:hypothetical protein